jgi:hypothetical protein
LPEVSDDGSNQQQVSLASKLASIIEEENRRVNGFPDRLIAASNDNSRENEKQAALRAACFNTGPIRPTGQFRLCFIRAARDAALADRTRSCPNANPRRF